LKNFWSPGALDEPATATPGRAMAATTGSTADFNKRFMETPDNRNWERFAVWTMAKNG